jgi:hypothetical protein
MNPSVLPTRDPRLGRTIRNAEWGSRTVRFFNPLPVAGKTATLLKTKQHKRFAPGLESTKGRRAVRTVFLEDADAPIHEGQPVDLRSRRQAAPGNPHEFMRITFAVMGNTLLFDHTSDALRMRDRSDGG